MRQFMLSGLVGLVLGAAGMASAANLNCYDSREKLVLTTQVRGGNVIIEDLDNGVTKTVTLAEFNSSNEIELWPGGLNDWKIDFTKENGSYGINRTDDCRQTSYYSLSCR